MRKLSYALIVLLFCALPAYRSLGQGTAFNYQGQLNTTNGAANGNYDFQFALYAGSTGGSPTTPMVTNSAVAVTNGSFTTAINFGANVFTGETNWLDIAVRTNGNGGFTELTPRQQILPVPYAIYAPNAGTATTAISALTASNAVTATTAVTASNIAIGAITGSSIAAGTITAANIASGQVVKTLNGLSDAVTLSVANNITLTTNGSTLTIGSSGDFLYAYLTGQTASITSGSAIPVSTALRNGWGFNNNYTSPVFTVPDTGYYLIHIDALPSTANPAIGVEYNVSNINGPYNLILSSVAYGSTISSSCILQLTAGEYIEIANATSGAIEFQSAYSSATLFSVSVTRIN